MNRTPITTDTPTYLSREELTKVKQRFSIIGNSPLLLHAIDRAVRVAPIDLSVLVTGESGSGKEFFPKIIHHFGSRKHKKYIAVNCGAIPEGTIDSELFGHEKGSFTGAIASRKGYFEEADGGTIFLDEVAELPLTTQARLLRVLESGEYLRVGSSDVQKTDIRVVAATNVDLQKAVREGKFREDLYYRLSTITIHVPCLHDRGDDVWLLARKFAADFSDRYMTPPVTFGDEARRLMLLYRWPGNVRQLKNAVEQLALFHAGEEVDARELSELLPSSDALPVPGAARHDYETERELLWQTLLSLRAELDELKASQGIMPASELHQEPASGFPTRSIVKYSETRFDPFASTPLSLQETEKDTIIRALERNAGSRKKAAAELNISERTLYRKIRDFGLDKK